MSHFPIFATHHERPRWYWWLILVGAPAALAFGTFGYWEYDGRPPGVQPWLTALYHSLQLFILHMPHLERHIGWSLELGRWLAVAVFAMTALMALFKVLSTEFRHFTLQFVRDHAVICGTGPRALELAHACFHQGHHRRVVVVAPSVTPEEFVRCNAVGATLVVGPVSQPETLVKARVHQASRLIALCEQDNTNVEIAVQAGKLAADLRPEGRPPLRCHAHLGDVDLRASLQRRAAALGRQASCQVHFFDQFDAAARRVLVEPDLLPIDRGGIAAAGDREVHLVILGFGRMGRSLALRAAQLGHFGGQRQLRISVLDRDAVSREQALLFRYPTFARTCDVEFFQSDVESRQARELLDRWCEEDDRYTSIAVCFDRDALALEVALRLLPRFSAHGIPAAVRMSQRSGFASLLRENGVRAPLASVRAFGMTDDGCGLDDVEDTLNEHLASALFGHLHQRCPLTLGPPPHNGIDWARVTDNVKDSFRQQADFVRIKLHAIGCDRVPHNDPRPALGSLAPHLETLAAMEHERWVAEQWLAGWTPGNDVDRERRRSPHLVAWRVLDSAVQQEQRNTARLLPDILRTTGEKICEGRP